MMSLFQEIKTKPFSKRIYRKKLMADALLNEKQLAYFLRLKPIKGLVKIDGKKSMTSKVNACGLVRFFEIADEKAETALQLQILREVKTTDVQVSHEYLQTKKHKKREEIWVTQNEILPTLLQKLNVSDLELKEFLSITFSENWQFKPLNFVNIKSIKND